MGQRKKGPKRAGAKNDPKWLRTALYVGVPLVVIGIIVAIAVMRMPVYDDLSVIGQQPAIVQVYLPG